jgi:CheY-like chemotaxis protein
MEPQPESKPSEGTRVLDAQLVHDLRNPLGAIHAAARLLIRSKRDPEFVQKMAEAIRDEVNNLMRLLDSAYDGGAQSERRRSMDEGSITPQLKVLVADDDPESARTLAMCLRLEGHDVSIAYSGDEALQLAESEHPQVMVLDVSMPLKDGYEVARELRARDWSADTKLIAVSGYSRAEDEARANAAGFDAYITKPIDLDRLNDLLLS